MIDVEPLIIEKLEGLVPSPGAAAADWRDVERRAGIRPPRRRLTLATAALVAVVFVAVALARSFGSFSDWLTGAPGKPVSTAQQQAFGRSIRSWTGFPRGTQLRQLTETTVHGATYTLYGFRGAGTLCLRLVVSGNQSAHERACLPLSLLRSSPEPTLVVIADYGVGVGKKPVPASPVPINGTPPQALVTLGIVADGVEQVTLANNNGHTRQAVVAGDAFLSVDYAPSPSERLAHVWALSGARRVAIPFTLPTTFAWVPPTAPPLSAHGPATVQRVVHGGTINWLTRHQPVGVAVPKTLHASFAAGSSVIFAREITPDPSAPEKMVVSLLPLGAEYANLHLLNKTQVCAKVVGGRYPGAGGCWPTGRLFSTAPFSWQVTSQPSVQYVTIAGVASDAVARLRLYLGSGQQEAVPLHDNGYIVEAPSADYPLRLVAYDTHGLVIGIVTFHGQPALPAGTPKPPQPIANPHWRHLFTNNAGAVFVAPSTSGGNCYAIRTGTGGGSLSCPRTLPPNGLDLSVESSKRRPTITIHTGTAITQIIVHYRNGHTQTIKATDGIALTLIPTEDETSTAFHGVVALTGLDTTHHIIASVNIFTLTGGSGTIRKLTRSSISIGTETCSITSLSPPLTGYQPGIHVQYLCNHGTLTLIGRSTPSRLWKLRTTLTTGPIATLTPTTITVKDTQTQQPGSPAPDRTCSLTPTSPTLHGYHDGQQVQIFCADGKLTGINRTAP